MKYILTFLLCTSISFIGLSQNFIGAWETIIETKSGDKHKMIVTLTDKYQVWTSFNIESGELVNSMGGSWTLIEDTMVMSYEFSLEAPETFTGISMPLAYTYENNTLTFPDVNIQLKRLDDGTPGELEGAWLMYGRMLNEEFTTRDANNSRKTMKILSGTRFQWIAYDTEKKQFIATGGGTYTTENGEYTEKIEFFSRDITRVGMELKFNYELKDKDWHHTGFSSKGDPIDETWRLRE